MHRIRAALLATAAFAVSATSALASTSHALFWQNKASTVVCGVKLHPASKPATLVICSAKGIPKAKSGVGDPFVQIGRTGKPKLVLESQDPFAGNKAKTLANGSSWSSLGVTCGIASKTVTCRNSAGHGFTIGTGKYKSF